MSLSPGQILGHYRIVAKLGEGGMGEVFEAQDQVLGRLVALKTLTDESATKSSRLERFRTEAKAIAALNHPNIVHIYSVEEVDDVHFLTMEKVDGKPLNRATPEGGMAIQPFLAMAIKLVSAVSAAHKQGVTHRDLKPANILIDAGGHIKVLDFGLAKIAPRANSVDSDDQHTAMMTRVGSVIGSAPYMSPEQARGEAIDSRTDIFSLGIVLYQALTGISPFHRKSSVESQVAVIKAEPKPLASLRPELPESVSTVLHRAMAKEIGERYQTADELLHDLQLLEDEVRLASASRTELVNLALPGGNSLVGLGSKTTIKKLAWPVGAIIVILAAFLVWTQFNAPAESSIQNSVAVLPFDNLTGSPASDYLGKGIAFHLITQLSELADLRVVGRSEAWDNPDLPRSRQELARRLGVGLFLEGAVQRDGDQLSVSVQMSDARTNSMVWGETFHQADGQLMQLQSDISRRVTTFLQVPLSRSERRRLSRNPTQSFRAYDFYLQGQDHLTNRLLRRGPELAASAFQQAIRLDQEFALAHVGLSEALWRRYRLEREDSLLIDAEEEARRALEFDPHLAAAQVAIARLLRERGDIGRSIAELQQAAASHPKPDEAYIELGNSYQRIGEAASAEQWFRAATAFGTENWWNWNALGFFLSDMGRYQEAEDAFKRTRSLAPEDQRSWVSTNLVGIQILQGRYAEAAATFEGNATEIGNAALASNLGTAYFFNLEYDRVEPLYLRATQLSPNDPAYRGNLGDLYTKMGRTVEAETEYSRAAQLARTEATSTGNASDGIAARYYGAKSHQCGEAMSNIEKIMAENADDGHSLASIQALCGTPRQAITAVKVAIDLGYPSEMISADQDFDHLKNIPEFDLLVKPQDSG